MSRSLQFLEATPQHVKQIMLWFDSEQSLKQWSGPNFQYPFTFDSFQRDLKLNELSSYVLIDSASNCVAFGQFYQRLDCLHLGRLVVNPEFRGLGLAKTLIQNLINKGREQLNLNKVSLFVLKDNVIALKTYQSLGFIEKEYPEAIGLENCLYMVKPLYL